MTLIQRSVPALSRVRTFVAPAMAVVALALTATAFTAPEVQKKPELKVEASRGSQGARLVFHGKNFPANARIVVTATRAPGTNTPQKFGVIDSDSTGAFKHTTSSQCTTDNMDDARENVTFTAADSTTPATKATARVDGSSWMCM